MNNKKILLHKLINESTENSFQRKELSNSEDNDKKENQSPELTVSGKTTKSSNFYISPRSEILKNGMASNDINTSNLTNTKLTNNNTIKFNSDDSIHENDFEEIGKILKNYL
jgi:hypothetical protein